MRILDDAVKAAVQLSQRYIHARQLPDKAVGVLDTACAKVALGQSATPAALGQQQRAIERIDAHSAALTREQSAGAAHTAALAELAERRAACEAERQRLQQRWAREQTLGAEIGRLRAELETGADPERGVGMASLIAELHAVQGEAPLVPLQVDAQVIAQIVAGWTGIPLGRMVRDDVKAVMNLQGLLDERILGQQQASAAVAQRIRTARASLDDPGKPTAVFLFAGPSGVGKTETALALAELLYGGARKLITINLSEYQEPHSVAGLKGSPPGYVGYGEGGVLTEAVRRNPYSVVLLDEVEKAHPDVLELFYQVFDKGVLDDAEGRSIDFRNTIVIATSNLGSAQIMQACLNKPPKELPAPEALATLVRPLLTKHFKPAFLGRLMVVPFYPLGDAVLANIIRQKLDRIGQRLRAMHRAEFRYDEALVDAVLARCTEVDAGARNVDAILNGGLLPDLAESLLAAMAEGASVLAIKVGVTRAGKFKYAIDQV